MGKAVQEASTDTMERPEVDVRDDAEGIVARLSGHWTTRTVADVDQRMRKLETMHAGRPMTIDLSQVDRIDTAGAWIVERLIAANKRRGVETKVTGASGAPYGLRLLDVLLRAQRTVHLVLSPAAVEVMSLEVGRNVRLDKFEPTDLLEEPCPPTDRLHFHGFRDFRAGIASGSFPTAGMVVCPCSMGTAAAIAHGLSENLIHRAADVHLKERRKLVLVPRETPIGLVGLRNLTHCAEAGAVVLPAMPAFYTKPNSIADMVDFVVGRICDQLGVEQDLVKRWGRPPTDSAG